MWLAALWEDVMWCNSKALCSVLILLSRADPCEAGEQSSHTLIQRDVRTHLHKHAHMEAMAAFSSTCGTKVDRPAHRRGEGNRETPSDSDCSAVLEKTREFFQICDIESKGFITRRDMQVRMMGRERMGFVVSWEFNWDKLKVGLCVIKKKNSAKKCKYKTIF